MSLLSRLSISTIKQPQKVTRIPLQNVSNFSWHSAPRRKFSAKVDYYYSQAATQITYWRAVQAHAILPESDNDAAYNALSKVAGLASGIVTNEGSLNTDSATASFHADDDNASDDDFPPRVYFLPAGATPSADVKAAVTARGGIFGVSAHFFCEAPREEWDKTIKVIKEAKENGLKVKILLHDAMAVDMRTISLITALLCDAGADILTLNALGEVDEDDISETVDAMKENDVVGVPISMRLGMRFGPNVDEDDGGAHAKSLAEFAAEDLEVFHFDTCPLGESALTPGALAEALEEAGVESRIVVHN